MKRIALLRMRDSRSIHPQFPHDCEDSRFGCFHSTIHLAVVGSLFFYCTTLVCPRIGWAKNNSAVRAEASTTISFKDVTTEAGIDFVHYAPRPRWCEIGTTVRGAATNEELLRVYQQEKELWKSRTRLFTLKEFAPRMDS